MKKLRAWALLFLPVPAVLFVAVPTVALFLSVDSEILRRTVEDREVWQAVWVSFKAAFLSTCLGVLIGIPFAYSVSRMGSPFDSVFESFYNLPVVVPHVVVGIALLNVFNGRFGIDLVDTFGGIVVAMCFVSFSFVVGAAVSGFRSIDERLIWTARTLGATPFQAFRFVILPLIAPFVLRGAVLAFARALSEVGALLVVAYHPVSAPILILERFENYGLRAALPVAALMLFLSFILFTAIFAVGRRSRVKS